MRERERAREREREIDRERQRHRERERETDRWIKNDCCLLKARPLRDGVLVPLWWGQGTRGHFAACSRKPRS